LRLADVERLGLESEPVVFGKISQSALRDRLRINGATEAEIRFLLSERRVELNAMTSRQFVDFLEAKLIEHSAAKVIPGVKTLKDAYSLSCAEIAPGGRRKRPWRRCRSRGSSRRRTSRSDCAHISQSTPRRHGTKRSRPWRRAIANDRRRPTA
jgi:hypothetical protein